MTTFRYQLVDVAYFKIFFHASKHPHKPVNGVLLGNLSGETIEIQDVIPLLHHWTSLSPMMEIGLDLARRHAAAKGLAVVGYYQACERLDDTSLAPVGEKIAESILAEFPEAVALVIDGEKLGTEELALITYLPTPGTSLWRPATTTPLALVSADAPARAVAAVRDERRHALFGDFDDHLEDVSIDWLRNDFCFKGLNL